MSEIRALLTGPMIGGICEEKTAANRVRPPSTCSMYTKSAAANPICGCASGVSSIFTTRTGPSTPSRPLRTLFALGLVAPGT